MILNNTQSQAAAAAISGLQAAGAGAAMVWFGSTQVTVFGNGAIEVMRTGMSERYESLAEFQADYSRQHQLGEMSQKQLAEMTDKVFSIVLRNDITNWTRYETQKAFRAEAIRQGVDGKTKDVGSIVTRCMARLGYGS